MGTQPVQQLGTQRPRPAGPARLPSNCPRNLSHQPINRQRAHHATPAKHPTNPTGHEFPKKGSRKRITGQMPGGFQPEPFVSKPRQPCLPTVYNAPSDLSSSIQEHKLHPQSPRVPFQIRLLRPRSLILPVAAAAAVAASSLGPAPAPTSGASMAAPAVAAASLTALVFGYLF
ncbi:hypothetical protein HU200_026822 [Digitaria exilis]|uniref:Uncharacterized protein n=2 Tax=PACMAD clade TaxID=147370 RepID=A0A835BYU9_9POAL|nr:hypothetical protein HU200_026822 [Digitaria exilis]